MNIYWIITAVIFLIIEILTPGIFLFSCFSIGGIIAFVVSLFSKSIILQGVVFTISSVLAIYFLRPLLMKVFVPKGTKSNVDSLIGEVAIVVEYIDGTKKMGIVKVNNELWRAVANEKILENEEVEIVKVEGAHLVVKRK